MNKFILIILLFTSCFSWSFEAILNKKPNAFVYIAEPSLPSEKKAAEELISYFKQMSGVELPLSKKMPKDGNRIIIGNSEEVQALLKDIDLKNLKPDEIVICTPDVNTLVLSGSKPRGTLFAVYTLLEMLGVRFWSPEYEFIPHKKKIIISNLMHRYAPPFDFRQAHSQSRKDSPAWFAKLKMNGEVYINKIPEEYGGSFQMDITHSLVVTYLKPEDFFKSHPEWYAWREKEKARIPKQICMTNQEALEQLVKEVRNTLSLHPERKFISVAFPDTNECCQCKNCIEILKNEESYSALSVYGANYVARAIKDEYPRVRVMIMAYWTTERPPKFMKMEPNCGVVFAMINRNRGVPPSATPRHNPFVKKWSQISHGNIYIWDYYATFSNFLLPMPNLYTMENAIRTYQNYGIKGIFAQLPLGSIAEFEELRNYLLAKLCWDPNLSSKKLIAEYLQGVCGQGAPYIQQYIDLLEIAKNRQHGTWIGIYGEKTDHWLRASDILKGRELFEQAFKETAQTIDVQRRIRRLSATIILVSILRYQDILEEAQKQKKKFPSYAELVDQLENIGREFQCDTYREWEPFNQLIKRLRDSGPKKKHSEKVKITKHVFNAKDLQGFGTQIIRSNEETFLRLSVNSAELFFPWMSLEKGSIICEIPIELAGRWNVMLTIRAAATIDEHQDVAYLGIYDPREICRRVFSVSRGDTAWQTICLGEWDLPAKSKIWVMPGVIASFKYIDVKNITLIPAETQR